MKTEADDNIPPNTTPISSTYQTNVGSPTTVPPLTTELTEVSAGSKRLHVTNLPFRIRDSDLQEMFGVRLNDIRFKRILQKVFPKGRNLKHGFWFFLLYFRNMVKLLRLKSSIMKEDQRYTYSSFGKLFLVTCSSSFNVITIF